MSFLKSLATNAVNSMQKKQQGMNNAREWAENASDDEVVRYAINGSDAFKKGFALQQVKLRGLESEYRARK